MKRSSMNTILAVLALLVMASSPVLAAQDEDAPRPAKAKTAPASHGKRKPKPPVGNEIDINNASKATLQTLPGITPALADKIIAGRPYDTKVHLVLKNILSMTTFQPIKGRIIAKEPLKTAPKTK